MIKIVISTILRSQAKAKTQATTDKHLSLSLP